MNSNLFYDHDVAVRYIAERTEYPAEMVEKILIARDDFMYGMGIISPQDEEDWKRVRAARAIAPSLFPSEAIKRRCSSFDGEAEFIVRATGVRARDVVAIIAEDTAYQAACGIVDQSMVDGYRSWSSKWVSGHAALNVDIENQA